MEISLQLSPSLLSSIAHLVNSCRSLSGFIFHVCTCRYLSRERRLLEIQRRSILPKTDQQGTMSTLSPHSTSTMPAMTIHQSSSSDPIAPTSGGRRMSRFEVTPVDSSQITFSLDPAISEPSSPTDPRSIPLKSILKHTTVSYPGHTTTSSSYGKSYSVPLTIFTMLSTIINWG